jgi:hypothetical protein
MKVIIVFMNVIFIFSVYLYLNRESLQKIWIESVQTTKEYVVPGIAHPEDIISTKNRLYILKGGKIVEWEVKQKRILSSQIFDSPLVMDLVQDSLYICSWENFEISSPEEFSTLISWSKYGSSPEDIWIKKTVKPIKCLPDKIIAANAFPTLQEKYYEINLETGDSKEINEEEIQSQEVPQNIKVSPLGEITVLENRNNPFLERIRYVWDYLRTR